MMDLKKLSKEEKVKKRLNELIDLGNLCDECQNYGLPQLLHSGACTHSKPAEAQEDSQVW